MTFLDKDSVIVGEKLIATIGFFDGVHKGHEFLLNELIREAKKTKQKSMIVTFANYPKSLIKPEKSVVLITTLSEKLLLLNLYEIDYCLVLDFDENVAKLTAEEFAKFLNIYFSVNVLLLGYDNHFGSDRVTDDENSQVFYENTKVFLKQIKANKTLSLNQRISSSVIRDYLKRGNIQMVTKLLGRNYSFKGKVVNGNHLGTEIGFPTANIEVEKDKLLPQNGVYAVGVLVDNQQYKGMLNIGNRPTFNGSGITVEVNIFDFNEYIYGKIIEIQLIKFIREEQKFDSLETLKNQLIIDKEQIIAKFGK
jgi:riboflavin kinase/FMN adenylyltransferase